MADKIYTIPIKEVFEPMEGCPLCRLHKLLEQRCTEYIMGAAMMEPDIRIETNKQGFCASHFEMMLARKNRLSLALMLESHLDELLNNTVCEKTALNPKKAAEAVNIANNCYVCNKIEETMQTMINNMFKMYCADDEFKRLYENQPCLCFNHYARIAAKAPKALNRKQYEPFMKTTLALTKKSLEEIKADTSHFCKMFDYRSAQQGLEWGNAKTACERAAEYLTSKKFTD